jgi:hypothetical protein
MKKEAKDKMDLIKKKRIEDKEISFEMLQFNVRRKKRNVLMVNVLINQKHKIPILNFTKWIQEYTVKVSNLKMKFLRQF